MILQDRKMFNLLFLIALGLFTYLLVHLLFKKIIGYPIASYLGAIFFCAMIIFSFLLRDVLSRQYEGLYNILNFRYYLTLQPLIALFVVLPFIIYLVYSVINISFSPARKAISVFTGLVENVSLSDDNNSGYDMVRFTTEKIYKGNEMAVLSAKSGLIVPEGCGLNFKAGELYLVYIMNYLGFDYISCIGTRKIDRIDIPEEEVFKQ